MVRIFRGLPFDQLLVSWRPIGRFSRRAADEPLDLFRRLHSHRRYTASSGDMVVPAQDLLRGMNFDL